LGGEVEVGQRERRRQPGEARQAGPPAVIDGVDLDGQQPFQERGVAQLGGTGMVKLGG